MKNNKKWFTHSPNMHRKVILSIVGAVFSDNRRDVDNMVECRSYVIVSRGEERIIALVLSCLRQRIKPADNSSMFLHSLSPASLAPLLTITSLHVFHEDY